MNIEDCQKTVVDSETKTNNIAALESECECFKLCQANMNISDLLIYYDKFKVPTSLW